MTVMKLSRRRVTCDACGATEHMVAPRLRYKHSSYELPPGWVVNKTPGKGIQILCGGGCSLGQANYLGTGTDGR